MYMEADEQPRAEYSVVRSESRVVRAYSQSPDEHTGTSISRVEHYEPEVVISSSSLDPQNPTPAEQKFVPSYLSAVPFVGRQVKVLGSSLAASIAGRYGRGFDPSILGSGDFSVLDGGTFYPDGDEKINSNFYKQFYKNGHGAGPYAEALTDKRDEKYPEDPLADFKDFADINTGSDASFSHYVVIYANKNSTKPHPSHPSPKNIFEQLQLLDLEKNQEQNTAIPIVASSIEEKEEKSNKKLMKLSKYKSKLAKTKVVKKYKKKLGPKAEFDYIDPLIATS